MKQLTSSILIILLFLISFACEKKESIEKQNIVANASSKQSSNTNSLEASPNANVKIEESKPASAPNQLIQNTEKVIPSIFNITDIEVEKAFTEGEKLYRSRHQSGGNQPIFGKENKIEFRLPTKAKLTLSIVFKTPRDEAQERGYFFAKGSPKDRAEILALTKKLVAQHSKQVNFQTFVKEWSNPQFGDDNTPSVNFTMKDVNDNQIEPSKNPQLDFCVGFDLMSCVAGSAITFPLYQGEKPVLTNEMDSVTLAIDVDGSSNETTFRLK